MPRRPLLAIIVCVALIGFVPTQQAAAQPADAQIMPPPPSPFHDSLMKLVAEYRGACANLSNLEQMHDPLANAQREQKKLIEQQIGEMARQELVRATNEREMAAGELSALTYRLREITHRTDVSAESLEATARSLEELRETLLLQSAGEQAKRDAIESAIAARSTEIRDRLQNDQVILELQKSVKLRGEALKGIQDMAKVGVSPQSDVNAAQAALLQDQLQLAQRQQQIADGAGADTVSSLNEQMTALVIGQKEQQARLDFISKRLQELSQALDSVDRLQQFKEESLRAQARLENAEQDKDWVDAEIQQTESPATQPTTAP